MNLNNINENTKPTGLVKVTQTNAAGEIVKEFTVPNLVVTSGRNHIAEKIVAGVGVSVSMSHMAIGTGNANPVAADISLGTEASRVALVGSQVSGNQIIYSAQFGAGQGTGAITEAGIFNSSSIGGGTMLCRVVFSQVNKAAGDSIAITWTVTIS